MWYKNMQTKSMKLKPQRRQNTQNADDTGTCNTLHADMHNKLAYRRHSMQTI